MIFNMHLDVNRKFFYPCKFMILSRKNNFNILNLTTSLGTLKKVTIICRELFFFRSKPLIYSKYLEELNYFVESSCFFIMGRWLYGVLSSFKYYVRKENDYKLHWLDNMYPGIIVIIFTDGKNWPSRESFKGKFVDTFFCNTGGIYFFSSFPIIGDTFSVITRKYFYDYFHVLLKRVEKNDIISFFSIKNKINYWGDNIQIQISKYGYRKMSLKTLKHFKFDADLREIITKRIVKTPYFKYFKNNKFNF